MAALENQYTQLHFYLLLTLSKLNNILFRDVYVGGEIIKRSKGTNDRSRERDMMGRDTRSFSGTGWGHRSFHLLFFRPYTLLGVYTYDSKLGGKKTKPSRAQPSKER